MRNRPTGGSEPADLLLVEDSPGDIRLLEEAFQEDSITNTLHSVTSGKKAIDFVRRRGDYEDVPRPDLILLDWHLPAMDGDDVLVELEGDDDLSSIPVIVLTGSESEREALESDTSHPNAYLTKPVETATLVETVRTIEEFWLTIVKRPPDERDVSPA